MHDTDLVLAAKEIIANGRGCDRGCENLSKSDFFCGCEDDARKIIDLVRHNDKP
jgi:hypothetical protein